MTDTVEASRIGIMEFGYGGGERESFGKCSLGCVVFHVWDC